MGWQEMVQSTLVSGGLGAGLGVVGTALVQMFGNKAESRAKAADLITDAAGGLATTAAEMVARLDKDNQQLREAVLLLTDVLDELMPQLDADPEVLAKLRRAKRAARMAV